MWDMYLVLVELGMKKQLLVLPEMEQMLYLSTVD